MLEIKNLSASSDQISILNGVNLSVGLGEIIAVMGPNGSGKSTLANVLAGNPSYQVTGGEVYWQGSDLLAQTPEERAASGLFLAFQYPATIPGVPISQFLRLCLQAQETARGEVLTTSTQFLKKLRASMQALHISAEFAQRSVGDGFSGGEKKRLEMLQMLVLEPRLVILDEIDSGLDIDAIRIVAQAVQQLERSKTAILIITHYQRLLNYITPDHVHVLQQGKITRSGDASLAIELEKTGYGD